MFPKSSRVRFSRRLSTLRGVVLFPAAPTLPTISNRTGKRNMVSNVLNPQADAAPQRQPFSFRYLVSPCRRSDVPQAATLKHFTDLAHSLAPNAACHLPSPAPNHPPVGRALGSLPRLRPKRRASHKCYFRLARKD